MRCIGGHETDTKPRLHGHRPLQRGVWKAEMEIKVKEVDLYSAFIVIPHNQGAQVRITQCYLQITPYLPLPCKHSPDGASPD